MIQVLADVEQRLSRRASSEAFRTTKGLGERKEELFVHYQEIRYNKKYDL